MLLFTHPSMMRHEIPPGHPEKPLRLEAVLRGLMRHTLDRHEAPFVTREAIERVHAPAYVAAMEAAFAKTSDGMIQLDSDTFASEGTREAVYRAAGAVVAAVDAVMAGVDDTAFCAVRPPGHHAEPDTVMGFCVFNNVAIGAMHALEAHGLKRVAIVDFDVHHGNGTQTIAEREPRLLFISTHQSPLYPGTGLASETGIDNNVVNVPLEPGAGGREFRKAMMQHVIPALDAFAPELLLVSAGFDAHADDPLAQLAFQPEDYAWAGEALRQVSLRNCKGKLVSTLEGGYDLAALARSASAYVEAQMRS
jgi:acetoin utilization deacetylase AcuC-like enzyme